MNTKEFKEAFDMIFSEILFNPLFLSNEEDKNNFDPTLSVLKDPICKLILRFEKTNKNEKLIKLSNAAILITKFLIKNDKKTSKNNILTKIKDKLEQNSTLSIFINNIDGNVYKLLKTLEMYGLIKDIKFNYKKLKKVYLGGKEWMFFERTGNVDYLQPRVILTEEAKKLKAQLIINLCGDFITKHPNSLQCCDIIRDLLKQLDVKQDKLNIYNEKLKILSYYDIGYGNEIKKMHADNCIDGPNTLFDGNYGDYGIDTKETFDKKTLSLQCC